MSPFCFARLGFFFLSRSNFIINIIIISITLLSSVSHRCMAAVHLHICVCARVCVCVFVRVCVCRDAERWAHCLAVEVFACVYQISLTNSIHDWQLSSACRCQPPSCITWKLNSAVGSLSYTTSACVFVCVCACVLGHCYRFLPVSYFIIH